MSAEADSRHFFYDFRHPALPERATAHAHRSEAFDYVIDLVDFYFFIFIFK